MALNRSEKAAVITEVTALAEKAQTLVLAEYRGITVAGLTQLRVNARNSGVTLAVLKNTLARRAVAGTGFESEKADSSADTTTNTPQKDQPNSRQRAQTKSSDKSANSKAVK